MTSHQGKLKRWARRAALGLAGLVVLLIGAGVISEAVIRWRVAARHPVAGRLVDIGGRRMQIDCRGNGSPTVVLEAGLDLLGSLSWASVHDSLAATTRTCAYSRAGILWSDRSDRPFSIAAVVADLQVTLDVAGERAPFVLVGHSIGGLYATEFVRRSGADVAGIVLVDASHPDQVARLEAVTGVAMLPSSGPAAIGARLARSGLLRLLPTMTEPATAPAEVLQLVEARLPISLAALVAELEGLPSTFDGSRDFRAFGSLPLAVLTAGAAPSPSTIAQMGIDAAQEARMRAEWIAMQGERATWSTGGRHEVVEDATHYVQFDRPDAVVRAVRGVVGEVQAKANAKTKHPRGIRPRGSR